MAGEDGSLHRHLVWVTHMNAAAGAGILAFGVFPYAQDIEAGFLQRTFCTTQQPVGAHVDELVEVLADWQQQTVQ